MHRFHVHKHACLYKHAWTLLYIRTYPNTCTHMDTQIWIHAYILTYTQTCIHIHIHTNTHTHTYWNVATIHICTSIFTHLNSHTHAIMHTYSLCFYLFEVGWHIRAYIHAYMHMPCGTHIQTCMYSHCHTDSYVGVWVSLQKNLQKRQNVESMHVKPFGHSSWGIIRSQHSRVCAANHVIHGVEPLIRS